MLLFFIWFVRTWVAGRLFSIIESHSAQSAPLRKDQISWQKGGFMSFLKLK